MQVLLVFFLRVGIGIKRNNEQYKTPLKNKNYIEILEMPFIFNIKTVSTARRRCHTSHSRPDVVGCGREVAERA
jgi:hypothetical protein